MYKTISDFNITLTAEEVLKGQGIDPDRASKRLFENTSEVIEMAHALIKPVAMYTIVPVESLEHQHLNFTGGSFEGPLVARAMAGAEELNIALCTIGEDLENKVNEIMGNDPVKAVSLDGAGIAALRKVSQGVEDIISSLACEIDTKLGMRAQPGQEGWPIEQQRVVFSILPADELGILLTDSCLMIPRKSVSFVIPRGKSLSDSVMPCDFCSKRNRCEWKKEKTGQ